jgi:hypothetical protein
MLRLCRYFATLTPGRVVLWCYAIWYLVNVTLRFDAHPRLWATSVGLSGIIGVALWLSTRASSNGTTDLDGWQIFRLFLMPFCVSSFAALVKDAGYLLIFPPTLRENGIGLGAIAAFLLAIVALRYSFASTPPAQRS